MTNTKRVVRLAYAFALGFAGVICVARDGRAQASPYVPLDDIAYTYIDALMARGYLLELSALERPYTERSIIAAVVSSRTRESGRVVASWLDNLYRAAEKFSVRPGAGDSAGADTFRARGTADGYATIETSARRELMLPSGQGGVRPGMDIRLAMSGGAVAGAIRSIIDGRLNVDPDFAGRKDRRINGRTEDGYVSGQWKYGELAFGRIGRNWGPPPLAGLMLGNYAYTYDHLFAKIGSDRIHFSAAIARLNDSDSTIGPGITRYFSIHRLSVRLANVELAASESYVYAGPGRGLEPSLANPFNIYALSWRNENQEGNLGLGGDISLRTRAYGLFSAQVFIDDLQIDRSCDPDCRQPSSYGVTLSAEGLPVRGDQRAFAYYTRVSNLAYNNKNATEHYDIAGVSLGRGFSDYDELRGGLDLAFLPGTPVRLYVAHRRQGEGNYLTPFPSPAEYATTPAIFSGVVSGVTRAAVSGATNWRELEISGDVGLNHTTNEGHRQGVTTTGFVGRVRVAVVPRWSVSF